MNAKNYIKSQRLTYLVLGLVCGYFIMLNDEPLATWMMFGFVIVGVVLSLWMGKNGK
jgi:hypothetical protein